MKLLVTGATGFIGRALTESLAETGTWDIMAAVRKQDDYLPDNVRQYIYSGILPGTDWKGILQDVDCVIHTAARVHVMRDDSENSLDEFRCINTLGTVNLAAQAAEAGV